MASQGPSKEPAQSKKIKFKNVQFWVSDLLKTYDEQNETEKDWIASVGKNFKLFH